jgi:hypothetical protein
MPEILKLCVCICLLHHAGGIPEKAGEIVCLENGMSIAQWFKFCIGVSIASSRGPICCSLIGPSYILVEVNVFCP